MSDLTTFFAPTPWAVIKDGGAPIVRDAGGKLVADCFSSISTADQMENSANLIVAAVNALHAAAPGREMAATEALPALMDAARGLCAWAYSIVNPAGLPQDYHTLREILEQAGRWDG